jgi:hypothetical protein
VSIFTYHVHRSTMLLRHGGLVYTGLQFAAPLKSFILMKRDSFLQWNLLHRLIVLPQSLIVVSGLLYGNFFFPSLNPQRISIFLFFAFLALLVLFICAVKFLSSSGFLLLKVSCIT